MCLLQGCTPLRDDQRLGAACSGNIFHHSNNNLTSSVTEAIFERGETLFWLCYPKITKNLNPIIASHSLSLGDGRKRDACSRFAPFPPDHPHFKSMASQPLSTDDRALTSQVKALVPSHSPEPGPKQGSVSLRGPRPASPPASAYRGAAGAGLGRQAGPFRWEAGLSLPAQSHLWGSPAAAVVGNQLQHSWRSALETRASPRRTVSPQKTAHQKGTSTHVITEAPEIPWRYAAAKQGAHWSKRCNN